MTCSRLLPPLLSLSPPPLSLSAWLSLGAGFVCSLGGRGPSLSPCLSSAGALSPMSSTRSSASRLSGLSLEYVSRWREVASASAPPSRVSLSPVSASLTHTHSLHGRQRHRLEGAGALSLSPLSRSLSLSPRLRSLSLSLSRLSLSLSLSRRAALRETALVSLSLSLVADHRADRGGPARLSRALSRAAARSAARGLSPATPGWGDARVHPRAFMLIVARGDVARAGCYPPSPPGGALLDELLKRGRIRWTRARSRKTTAPVSISNTSNLLGADRQPSSRKIM